MKKEVIVEIIAYAFFILFIYTSFNKLTSFNFYLHDLKRSPLLSKYALLISIIIPLLEIIVAIFLILYKTRTYGLVGSLILMIMFTLYVVYVLAFTTERPCTCGGIIRELSWPNHLLFNIIFLLLAISGVILQKKIYKNNYA